MAWELKGRDMASEICVRCGSNGDDRRTLWMACLYAMHEFDVPFGSLAILGRRCELACKVPNDIPRSWLPQWKEPSGDERHFAFYTLRVCKRCRSEWMQAIERWFHETPQGDDHDADEPVAGCGSGIFVREGGAIREITEEEWYRRNPGQEPVRYVNKDAQ